MVERGITWCSRGADWYRLVGNVDISDVCLECRPARVGCGEHVFLGSQGDGHDARAHGSAPYVVGHGAIKSN